MTYENFTIKAQDAILKAQQIAAGLDQQVVDSSHLAKAIIETDEKLVEFMIGKLGANLQKSNLNWILKFENCPEFKMQINNIYPVKPMRFY